jgi:hypothetical protein
LRQNARVPGQKGAKSSCIGVGFRFSSAQQIEDAPVSAAEGASSR